MNSPAGKNRPAPKGGSIMAQLKILVVADEPDVANLFEEFLKENAPLRGSNAVLRHVQEPHNGDQAWGISQKIRAGRT